MMNWLRHSPIASVLLTLMRVWLGLQWALDGLTKITTKGGFSALGLIKGAIAHPVTHPVETFGDKSYDTISSLFGLFPTNYANGASEAYPWYTATLKAFTSNGTSSSLFDFLVAWGELFVGLGLIFGAFTILSAFFGAVMNFSYLLAGVVSINPAFLLMEFIILAAGFNAGKIGFDRVITPWLRKKIKFLRRHGEVEVKIEKAINSYK